MIFLESQHKDEVAIQIGNYFQRLELLLFVTWKAKTDTNGFPVCRIKFTQ